MDIDSSPPRNKRSIDEIDTTSPIMKRSRAVIVRNYIDNDRINKLARVARSKSRYTKKMPKRKYRRGPSATALALIDTAKRRQMILDQMDPSKARGSTTSRQLYGYNWANANAEQRRNRLETGYKGLGDYASWKPWLQRWVPKGSLAAAGGWLGGLAGGPAGAAFGSSVGKLSSNYLGWGKYRRRKNYKGRGDYGGDAGGNQIMAGSTDTPMTVNASDDLSGDIYFSHREFLGNVRATGGVGNISPFEIVKYPLNPGLLTTFPWLSQIANQFELYELHGCIFEYRPTSGELGATGSNSLGKIVMATNYDPDAPDFATSVQMENYDYANACKPSERMVHGIETADKQRATKMLYVRSGASSKDKLFTDLGNFFIATEGLPITSGTTANVGELWVSYRVKLSRAQLFTSLLGLSIQQDQFVGLGATGAGSSLFDNNAALPLTVQAKYAPPSSIPASRALPRLSNTLGGFLASTTESDIFYNFPPNISQGLFHIIVWINTNAAQTIVPQLALSSAANCVQVTSTQAPGLLGASFTQAANAAQSIAGTNGSCMWEGYVSVTAPGNLIANFTITFSAAMTTVVNTTFTITQCPSNIVF